MTAPFFPSSPASSVSTSSRRRSSPSPSTSAAPAGPSSSAPASTLPSSTSAPAPAASSRSAASPCPANQIVDNVVAAIEGVMAHVPKKWANVRSLHVKAVNSVALPIYQGVPELGLKIEVPVPRMPQKKDEMEEDAEDPIGEGEVVQEEEKPTMKEDRRSAIHGYSQ